MKYAIEQLEQYASIMSRDKMTKKVAYDLRQGAKRLEFKDSKYKYSFEVLSYLCYLKNNIKNGLKSFNSGNSLEIERRQKKRLKDVEEAISFIKQ